MKKTVIFLRLCVALIIFIVSPKNITTGICEYRLKIECFHVAVCCMNYEKRMNVLSWALLSNIKLNSDNFQYQAYAKYRETSTCTVILFMLLLLCGDIESNPGPVQFPCGVCEKDVRENQRAICCDGCDTWWHFKCITMSNITYKALRNSSKSWICCQCGLPNFDSSIFDNTEVITSNSFDTLNSCSMSNISIHSVLPDPLHTSSPIRPRQSGNKTNNIKAVVINTQCVKNKVSEFHCMLDEHNPDIVMVTETWLDPSIPSSDIIPTNYSVYRKDRQAGQTGGGVMIAVRNNLLSSACPDLDTDCELVWAKIELLGARNLYVGAYYRPPSAEKL